MVETVRVVTYNIHKCRGLDRRVRPDRIVKVLAELNADIIALQEVLSVPGGSRQADQALFISEELGLPYAAGVNRSLRGGSYGNVVLSRLPMVTNCNYDLSVGTREKRGCLRVDLQVSARQILHVFNLHLGTAYKERRLQARKLTDGNVLGSSDLAGPRIVLGDFNEWTRGLTTKLLARSLKSADIRNHLRRSRTYPGFFPYLLHLDHIYFDPSLEIERLALHRSRTALVASDHLPLVGDFRLPSGVS